MRASLEEALTSPPSVAESLRDSLLKAKDAVNDLVSVELHARLMTLQEDTSPPRPVRASPLTGNSKFRTLRDDRCNERDDKGSGSGSINDSSNPQASSSQQTFAFRPPSPMFE